jgi:hypothetical protein
MALPEHRPRSQQVLVREDLRRLSARQGSTLPILANGRSLHHDHRHHHPTNVLSSGRAGAVGSVGGGGEASVAIVLELTPSVVT